MSTHHDAPQTRNFTLRLSVPDQARLERLAARWEVDRTGALRLLIRRATTCWYVCEPAFFPMSRLHPPKGALPIRLRLKGASQ